MVPYVNDPHSDHYEANMILSSALKKVKLNISNIDIFSYEVWSFVPANVYFDISDFIEKKCEVLMNYKVAMQVVDYVKDCQERSLFHGIRQGKRLGLFEAFYKLKANIYLKMLLNNSTNLI